MADGLKGLDKALANLAKFALTAPKALGAALYQEGLALDANMVPRIPVDYGRLRATHYVTPPEKSGESMTVEVGVGTEYAIPVHENTSAHHVTGEAKFLEKAFHARMGGFAERLAKRTWSNIKAGVSMVPLDGSTPTAPTDPGDVGRQLGPSRKDIGREKKRARRAASTTARRAKKAEKHAEKKAKSAAVRKAATLKRQQKRETKKLNAARRRASPKSFDF